MTYRLVLFLVLLSGVTAYAQSPATGIRVNAPAADTTAPTVTITSPTSAATYDAGTASMVALSGTASDVGRGLSASCTWTNSLGGSGTATGTSSWSIASVSLTVGSNVIAVTCPDIIGNLGTDVLTVSRSSGAASPCTDAFNAGNGIAVGVTATGTGSGADWNNVKAIPNTTSWVRGKTYCAKTGNYSAWTLSTPASGTTLITIVGATSADHGPSAGWSSALSVCPSDGGTPARIAHASGHNIDISTSYWAINGQCGTFGTGQLASYGFRLTKPGTCSGTYAQITAGQDSASLSFSTAVPTVQYVGIEGFGTGCDAGLNAFGLGGSTTNLNNFWIAHTYSTGNNVDTNITNCQTCIIEYNWFENHFYNGGNSGKEAIDVCSFDNGLHTAGSGNGGMQVRYNHIQDHDGNFTAMIAMIGGGGCANVSAKNWDIYGNVFENYSGNGGVISGNNDFVITNSRIYNNTFVNTGHGPFRQCENFCNLTSGNVFTNNLLYGSASLIEQGTGGGVIDHDYNSFCSPTDTPPSEPHRQTGCGDLFVSSGTGNYHLATDTAAWLTLASPFNIDPDGVTRTSSRGAYQKVP